MNKSVVFLIVIFVFLNPVFSAHLVENVVVSGDEVMFTAKKSGMFVCVYDRNGKDLYTCISAEKENRLKTKVKELKGKKLVVIDVEDEPEMKIIGGHGVDQGRFNFPTGIYVDYFSRLFVVDSMNDRIQVFTSNDLFSYEFGGFGWSTSLNDLKGRFNRPLDVVVGRFIYVVDSENHRVAKFDIDGNFIDSFGGNGSQNGRFYLPKGICMDLSGDIYVADTENDRIQKFDGSGNHILSIGTYGRGVKQFNKPKYVAVDNDYDIYVSDYRNNRVHLFDRFGSFKKYMKFNRKFVKSPLGISAYNNIIALVTKEKELIISSKGEDFIKEISLPFVPEDVFFNGSSIYISCPSQNRIYRMNVKRVEYEL